MDKKVILVADDDAMSRRVIHKFLHEKYEVLEAENGVEAMKILDTQPVDGVILDIIMPEKDGIDVLKELRQKEKYAFVGVLVATSTKERTERMALNAGADDVVAKPLDPTVILKRMENILIKKLYEREHQETNQQVKQDVVWQEYMQKTHQNSQHYLDEMIRLNELMEEYSGDEKRIIECTRALRQAIVTLQDIIMK